MPQLKSIRLAIELATLQRDECAKLLARFRRNLDFANEQMAQLEGYAAETDGRWMGAPPGMFSAELIRHHYQFMDRLQQAITLQNGALAGVQGQIDQATKDLLQAEFRLAGLNQILDARLKEQAQVQKRRDQSHTDEFASMAYARSGARNVQGETP
ncbi:MAG: flagellar export protein FliJ [Burkholderiales bacterium]